LLQKFGRVFSPALGVRLSGEHARKLSDTVIVGHLRNGRNDVPPVVAFINHKMLVCEGGNLRQVRDDKHLMSHS
tara:strand:- start:356 stop:577 length:222 start_codon:yes stop_codon:yes gene_type:complete